MTDRSALTTGQLARLLGVAETTIRTWDRRYGLGPRQREPGRHRRYDEYDVERFALMRRLTTEGVAPSEAARIALAAARPELITRPSASSGRPTVATSRAASRLRSGLRRAALAMDAARIDELLRQAIAEDVVAAWTHLIGPVLRDLGHRHACTGRYVEVEHLLSGAVSRALARVERPDTPPAVLLACAPDEQHTLPLEALAAALAAAGTASRLLGARVPTAALAAAIGRTGPRAVVLWAQLDAPGQYQQLAAALAARPRPLLVLAAGPGWAVDRLPLGVCTPRDLGEALDQIAEVVNP